MEFMGGIEATASTLASSSEHEMIIKQLLMGVPFMPSSSSSSSSSPSSLFPKPHNNHHYDQQQMNMSTIPMMQSPPSSSSYLLGNHNELRELDQGFLLYLDSQVDDHPPPLYQPPQNRNSSSLREGEMRQPIFNISPSQPTHVEPSSKVNSKDLQVKNNLKRSSEKLPPMKLSNDDDNKKPRLFQSQAPTKQSKSIKKREENRKGPASSSKPKGPKTPDPKILRRLAQNREAARKSRLRKKAYVQQLESSRIRLAQLELELQRAIGQGIVFGGSLDQGIPVGVSNISSDAAMFDMEYTRWVEEHHRLTYELRVAVHEHLPENELKMYVDNCLAHYDIVIKLKSLVAKTDVFHLVSGAWKTPAERCFMWIGGFPPSELIKIILHQIEGLTEEQLIEICGLQQSSKETEETLSQGLEALHKSLSEVIASGTLITWLSLPDMPNSYMHHMALAINKLSTLENFVRQADNLRQQTYHRLHQILTTRQAAICFLVIAEYFHRLRALSSLWSARPHEVL